MSVFTGALSVIAQTSHGSELQVEGGRQAGASIQLVHPCLLVCTRLCEFGRNSLVFVSRCILFRGPWRLFHLILWLGGLPSSRFKITVSLRNWLRMCVGGRCFGTP